MIWIWWCWVCVKAWFTVTQLMDSEYKELWKSEQNSLHRIVRPIAKVKQKKTEIGEKIYLNDNIALETSQNWRNCFIQLYTIKDQEKVEYYIFKTNRSKSNNEYRDSRLHEINLSRYLYISIYFNNFNSFLHLQSYFWRINFSTFVHMVPAFLLMAVTIYQTLVLLGNKSYICHFCLHFNDSPPPIFITNDNSSGLKLWPPVLLI